MSTEKRFRLSHILGMTLNRHEIVDKMSLDEFLREYDITPEEFAALRKALVLGRWRVLRREE